MVDRPREKFVYLGRSRCCGMADEEYYYDLENFGFIKDCYSWKLNGKEQICTFDYSEPTIREDVMERAYYLSDRFVDYVGGLPYHYYIRERSRGGDLGTPYPLEPEDGYWASVRPSFNEPFYGMMKHYYAGASSYYAMYPFYEQTLQKARKEVLDRKPFSDRNDWNSIFMEWDINLDGMICNVAEHYIYGHDHSEEDRHVSIRLALKNLCLYPSVMLVSMIGIIHGWVPHRPMRTVGLSVLIDRETGEEEAVFEETINKLKMVFPNMTSCEYEIVEKRDGNE